MYNSIIFSEEEILFSEEEMISAMNGGLKHLMCKNKEAWVLQ